MTLPRMLDRKPKRDGRLRCPAHLKWVRSHECCATIANAGWPAHCEGPIEAAHVRVGSDGGVSLKPGDEWVISLCAKHHRLQHGMGEQSFERAYRIDMKALAQEFAAKSPALKRKRNG